MTGTAIVTAVVEILISGLISIGEGIGGALSAMATAIFIGAEGLTVFGTLIIVFAAISLGLSLTRWVCSKCPFILRNIKENWVKTVKPEMVIPC